MSIFEIKGGRITHRYLVRKTKYELAHMYMDLLQENERLKALVSEMREDIMSWLKHSENVDAEVLRTPEEEHYSNELVFRADEALAADETKEDR